MVASHDWSTRRFPSGTDTVSGCGSTRSLISTKMARLNRYMDAPRTVTRSGTASDHYDASGIDFAPRNVKSRLISPVFSGKPHHLSTDCPTNDMSQAHSTTCYMHEL